MKTTASSKCSRLFDPIRKKYVAATPEERVRQALLQHMIHSLGFPKGLLTVEKEVSLTTRRADIVSHMLFSGEIRPLLVIECKKENSLLAAREQAMGYNFWLQAPFFCVASSAEIHTMWFEETLLKSVPFLPTFHDLGERAMHYLRNKIF